MQTCRSASVWLVNTIQTSLFVPLTPALPWAPWQRSGPPYPCPRLAAPRSLALLWSPRGIQGAAPRRRAARCAGVRGAAATGPRARGHERVKLPEPREEAALIPKRGAATSSCDLGVKSEITFLLPLEIAEDEVGREKQEGEAARRGTWHFIHPFPPPTPRVHLLTPRQMEQFPFLLGVRVRLF